MMPPSRYSRFSRQVLLFQFNQSLKPPSSPSSSNSNTSINPPRPLLRLTIFGFKSSPVCLAHTLVQLVSRIEIMAPSLTLSPLPLQIPPLLRPPSYRISMQDHRLLQRPPPLPVHVIDPQCNVRVLVTGQCLVGRSFL